MHPRVGLHQVAFLDCSTTSFVKHSRLIGVQNVTLVTQKLDQGVAPCGVRVAAVNHPFAIHPDLERDDGAALAGLLCAIDVAATLAAPYVYVLTGGRGTLTWEQAAHRFAELIAPAKPLAQNRGVTLLVENASPFNADIHIAHTLADVITLADVAGIGICIDLHACWTEAALPQLFTRAMPVTGLVQVSDYVLGDRVAPCRAVPGDGTIPLTRLLDQLLSAGYTGVFDLELVGSRIADEGAATASTRAADWLSATLTRLGA